MHILGEQPSLNSQVKHPIPLSLLSLSSFTFFLCLIVLVNISLCHTIHFIISFCFLIIQLTMDDVSSETCFAFIKKYWQNELQKHRVVHESDILLRAATKP